MVNVVFEPIDDEQAEMHIWPLVDFCGFGLEHAYPYGAYSTLESCPLNENLA